MVKGIYDGISLIYVIIKIFLINSDSITTEPTDPEVYNSVAPSRPVPADVFATRYSVGGKYVDGRRLSLRALSRRCF